MNEDRRRILEMLKKGKISVAEADDLLDAVEEPTEATAAAVPSDAAPRAKPKYLRVLVEDGKDHVDVRVPLQLLRAGIKFTGFIPAEARQSVNAALSEKGINFDLSDINPAALEELLEAFGDLSVNVGGDGEKVRVFCE